MTPSPVRLPTRRSQELTLRAQLPTISERPELAKEGGLISYGASVYDAAYRERRLSIEYSKAPSPPDLPVDKQLASRLPSMRENCEDDQPHSAESLLISS